MTRSLSGRLLIGVISLVLLGLLVADGTTYLTFQKFVLDRLDSQLTHGRVAAVGVLGGPGPGRGSDGQFPIGTVVELLRPDGTEIGSPLRYDFPSSTSRALPTSRTGAEARAAPNGAQRRPASAMHWRGCVRHAASGG